MPPCPARPKVPAEPTADPAPPPPPPAVTDAPKEPVLTPAATVVVAPVAEPAPKKRVFTWVAGGVGVAALGAAVGMGVAASGSSQRLRDGTVRPQAEAQALYETAVGAAAQSGDPDDPVRLGRLRMNAMLRIGHLLRSFEDFVPSSSEEVKKLQLGERDRLAAALDKLRPALDAVPAEGKPFEIRRDLERIHDELTRLETAFERLPSLGLVTDR